MCLMPDQATPPPDNLATFVSDACDKQDILQAMVWDKQIVCRSRKDALFNFDLIVEGWHSIIINNWRDHGSFKRNRITPCDQGI